MSYLSIRFVKADPCGNTTIMVLTQLPRERYTEVAQQLMSDKVLSAEQVGFVERVGAGSRLQMMGGEFCGNASRCFAAWLMMGGRRHITEQLQPLDQAQSCLRVEVSGHDGPLDAWVEDIGSPYGCRVEITMPVPSRISHDRDAELGSFSLVEFIGIKHGVLWEKAADEKLLLRFRELLHRRGLNDNCCGLMFVEKRQPLFIRPLVYVAGVESLTWEQSCGSGSLALVCALAHRQQQSYQRLPVHQPGGTLLLSCEYSDQGLNRTRLAGEIYFTAQGLAHLNLAE